MDRTVQTDEVHDEVEQSYVVLVDAYCSYRASGEDATTGSKKHPRCAIQFPTG